MWQKKFSNPGRLTQNPTCHGDYVIIKSHIYLTSSTLPNKCSKNKELFKTLNSVSQKDQFFKVYLLYKTGTSILLLLFYLQVWCASIKS